MRKREREREREGEERRKTKRGGVVVKREWRGDAYVMSSYPERGRC